MDNKRAMKDAGARTISLSQLVHNPSKERLRREYMVCIILGITNLGMAQTRVRIGGQQGRTQQSTPWIVYPRKQNSHIVDRLSTKTK